MTYHTNQHNKTIRIFIKFFSIQTQHLIVYQSENNPSLFALAMTNWCHFQRASVLYAWWRNHPEVTSRSGESSFVSTCTLWHAPAPPPAPYTLVAFPTTRARFPLLHPHPAQPLRARPASAAVRVHQWLRAVQQPSASDKVLHLRSVNPRCIIIIFYNINLQTLRRQFLENQNRFWTSIFDFAFYLYLLRGGLSCHGALSLLISLCIGLCIYLPRSLCAVCVISIPK